MSTSAAQMDLNSLAYTDKGYVSFTINADTVSPWNFQNYRISPFAMENINLTRSSGIGGPGQEVNFRLPHNVDFISGLFTRYKVPGIVGIYTVGEGVKTVAVDNMIGEDEAPGTDMEPYYTNAVGLHLSELTQMVVADTPIDTLKNWGNFFAEEFEGKPGKRLTEQIGKYDTYEMRVAMSRIDRELYHNNPFSFTKTPGLALPVCAVTFQAVEFKVKCASFDSCIVKPADFVAQDNAVVYRRPMYKTDAEVVGMALQSVQPSDISIDMIAIGIIVSDAERDFTSEARFEQIITQHVYREHVESHTWTANSPATKDVTMSLSGVRHVMTEYMFAVRKVENKNANHHYDFTGFKNEQSLTYMDPVVNFRVLFSGNVRTEGSGAFYRMIVPWCVHSSTPRQHIYNWSYAFDPESPQFTGGNPHARLQDVQLVYGIDSRAFITATEGAQGSVEILWMGLVKNFIRYTLGNVFLKNG